ncbi:MAG: hypothetical protein M8357_03060 [Desulfobulbaceae bacterium]|nr:hypothetical protein [Desulfobulbaceae bacterium]
MIKSKIFIGFTLAEILLLFLLFLWSVDGQSASREVELQGQKELVRHLRLTDFAIWTEARYTRHPSQTDFFSPFQDFPSSLEHFPAGSVIAPVFNPGSVLDD